MPTHGAIRIPLIGLLIERKTDLLAAAAFVMALIAALAQLYHLLLGPQVSSFPPEQSILILEELNDGRRVFRIGARMAYVNTGKPGYNATLRRETVSFTLADKTYIHNWQSERRFSAPEGKLKKEYVAEARPIPINAGSSVSREIYFSPYPERCRRGENDCDGDQQFLFEGDAIRLLAEAKVLHLTFSSYLFDDDEAMKSECYIDIDNTVMYGLVRHGWAAPPCWPNAGDDSSQ